MYSQTIIFRLQIELYCLYVIARAGNRLRKDSIVADSDWLLRLDRVFLEAKY